MVQDTEQDVPCVPYVRNTFLCVGPQKAACPQRSLSVSPKGSSDIFSRQLHSLLYKPTPVRAGGLLPWAKADRRPWEEMVEEEELEEEEEEKALLLGTPRVPLLRRTKSGPAAAPGGQPAKKGTKADGSSGDETGSTDVGESSPPSPPSLPSPRSPEAAVGGGEEETGEGVLRLLPKAVPADSPLPSVGSSGHEEGTCKPCVFAHHENKRCENGYECPFCHFPHPPKKRVRLCKKKRMELKRQQEEQQAGSESDY